MKGKLIVGTSPLEKIIQILPEIRGTRILDVGCGAGIYGYILRNKWQDTEPGRIQFQDFANRDINNDEPEFLVGCDIQIENLRRCRYHNIYDYLFAADAHQLIPPLPENFVDTILCIEVLEHLTKENALIAIENFKKIARQRIIITVPSNALNKKTQKDERAFLKINSEDPDVLEWIEAERHKSSYSIKELKNLGFQIGETITTSPKIKFIPKLIRRFYRNRFGRNSKQIMAIIDLEKDLQTNKFQQKIIPPEKITDGFPDYR